jgi:16S rRNA G966 N2-methylase RsmD
MQPDIKRNPELFVDYCDLSLTVSNPNEVVLEKFNNLTQMDWMARVLTRDDIHPSISLDTRYEKHFITDDGRPVFLLIDGAKTDYENYNIISSFFTDTIRAKGKKDSESVYNFFQNNKKKIFGAVRRRCKDYFKLDKYRKMHEIRETVYDIYGHRYECTSHRVTVPFTIYKYFGAQKILDYSAGWGDRAIAAMACGASYTGIDPNPELHDCYKRIVDLLKPKQKVEFIKICAEDHSTDEVYDIMYTSPPYYNLEKYIDHPDQSCVRYQTYENWKKGFYFKMLSNSIKHVKEGGHVIVNIINWAHRSGDYYMLDDMIDYMISNNQIFMGYIYYTRGETKCRAMPMAVFKVVHQ